jgi:flagella basal body P-ring formation protein FlgA
MIKALTLLLLGGTALAAGNAAIATDAGTDLATGAAGATLVAGHAGSAPLGAARARLLDHLHQVRPDIERFELTPIGPAPALHAVVATAEAIHGSALSARTCVWIKVGQAGHSAGSVPIWFSVKAYRPVLISQRNRGARDAVDASDFTVEERDVAPLSSVPLAVDTDVTRMRARRSIASGRVVVKEDLEEMPQVLRGQEVTVQVRHGAVEIETSAVALREARLGEPVTLQNPSSHMNYAARVVGQARVAVIE